MQRARAEVAALDGEIDVTQRQIEGQRFAVDAARAAVRRAEAQVKNATDSLERIEPLLAKEFVTPDKVDQARTAKLAAQAGLDEARRKMDQAEQDVGTLSALRAKRDAAQAALGKAELDLSFCYVRAPFDARVVNLHTAVGQFVAPGPAPVFSLVDARAWYVVANYRETDLARIAPGMEAEMYVLADPRHRFRGTVQGVGWAVNPEDQPIAPGLPKIRRELNWVHIAQRFPVRIRVENPEPPDAVPCRRLGRRHRSEPDPPPAPPTAHAEQSYYARACLPCSIDRAAEPSAQGSATRCSTFCAASWRLSLDVAWPRAASWSRASWCSCSA